ncbi:MAG TPA: aminopeptidase [Clostridia bacterium]
MNKDLLKKYAEVIIKIGCNIQKGDELVIRADVNSQEFMPYLTEAAYQAGAKKVTVLFNSDKIMKLRYLYEDAQTLTDVPEWKIKSLEYVVEKDAAYLFIDSQSPEVFAGVDADKMAAYTKAFRSKLVKFYDATMSNDVRWTIAAYPSADWAQTVFPNDENAVDKLFELIAKAMRLDTPDPYKAWQEHQERLSARVNYLNSANFKALKYKNSLGTDLYVELPENYFFMGGADYSKGRMFMANMPTEEVYAAPKYSATQGTLVASMPLAYNGSMVKNFSLTFKNGKVVDFNAEQGKEILKNILDTDEGARYLGEIAIVPYDSPIQKMNTLFLNTLFDENASCHFALGKAYPCVKGAENMTKEQLKEAGINDSLMHVDFMIGTADLEITGITLDGKEIKFFKNGNFVID